MQVPIGVSGVHAVPNTLHSQGLSTPLSTSPHWHAFGSATRTPGTRRAARRRTRAYSSPHPQRRLRDEAQPAPLEVRPQLHDLVDHLSARPGCRPTAPPGCTGSRPRSGPRPAAPSACRSTAGCPAARTRPPPAACRSSRAMNSYGRQPITVDTCPGPMKPSSRRSGESRMALMAGMIVTWLQKTEKFVEPLGRRPQHGHRGGRGGGLEADRHEHDPLVRVLPGDLQRVQRRVDHPDVGAGGLGVEERARGCRAPASCRRTRS